MTRNLHVEMGFDFICPWCLIGLRQLQAALALLRAEAPGVEVTLDWRGVQLLPDAPAGGWPFHEFYVRRLGSEAALRQRRGMVLEAARAAGVRINYAAIHTMPNTADAHRLLQLAARQGDAAQRDALLESLMVGYFERGDDLGRRDTLLAHAVACGYSPQTLSPALPGADVPLARAGMAAGGVPYYVIDGAPLGSGARSPALLLSAMRSALAAGAPAAP
jgi:predicted DsbA family dithiol-disulfide isomerase